MNKYQTWALKVDAVLALVDLKVALLAWMMLNLYRCTMILDGIPGVKIKTVADVTHYIWETCGAPYIVWIPVLAAADVLAKRALKSMIE